MQEVIHERESPEALIAGWLGYLGTRLSAVDTAGAWVMAKAVNNIARMFGIPDRQIGT
jgi:hypothetical protein